MTIPELCFWRLLESRKHWPTSPCNEADWIDPVREIQISPCFQHDFHDVKLVASNMDPLSSSFTTTPQQRKLFHGFKSSPPNFTKPVTKEDTGSKQCPTCHAIAGGPGRW